MTKSLAKSEGLLASDLGAGGGGVVLSTFAPIGSHVNENEKINIRKKIIFLIKNTSGHMAQGKQELKFERNPCNRFRDN